jgi:antitoxin HicB
MQYPITITEDDGVFLVHFPDIPEGFTSGETLEEAQLMAQDALVGILDWYMKHGKAIPMPSDAQYHAVELDIVSTSKVFLHNEMLAQNVKKAEMARRINMAAPNFERVAGLRHVTKINAVSQAFTALGKRLDIRVV